MAYDETLAARVRQLLAGRDDVAERPMFGGLTFMVAEHMCCGIHKDELIVRLDPDHAETALVQQHVRPMDLTGRPMSGFLTIRPEGLKGRALKRWVDQAVTHAERRPPKTRTPKEPHRR